jgi:hypothetical protein
MQIQITGVTSGNSPYDIYVCNWDLTACFYVSGVTTIPPNININTENYLPTIGLIKVKIIDADGCIEIIEFPCEPTPTPTPTPVPTPTPTPCTKPSGMVTFEMTEAYRIPLVGSDTYFYTGSTYYVGSEWNKRVNSGITFSSYYIIETPSISVGEIVYRQDSAYCTCPPDGNFWLYIGVDWNGPVYPNVYIIRISNCRIASITLWEYS